MGAWLIEASNRFNSDPNNREKSVHIFQNAEDNAFINDLTHYPHAFVLACLMDRQVKAERAWYIPCHIKRACEAEGGDFSIDYLCTHDDNWYIEKFKNGGNPIHRFPIDMGKVFHSGACHIKGEYSGDASRIWNDRPSSAALIQRFLQFKGAGIKIASMAANILVRQYGIEVSDYYSIDVSPDTHLQRVFHRMGFTREDAKREEIIYKARDLNPEYPGIMDAMCWRIGRDYCEPSVPHCSQCPVDGNCPKVGVTKMD